MILILAVVTSLVQTGVAGRSVQCEEANTTLDMQRCWERVLAEKTDSLQRVEVRVMAAADRSARPRFEQASRAWLLYRDLQCESVAQSFAGGSLSGITVLRCKITLTEHRVDFLAEAYKRTQDP